MKSWGDHIIGGLCVNIKGKYVLDTDIIRLAGISSVILRTSDFTSCLLVLKLLSFKSFENIMMRLDE